MKMKIEKIRDDLYIKKGWDGYRVAYPNKIDLSKPFQKGNINWKNVVGHWSYWVKCILFLIALYFFVQMYLADTKQCRDYVQNIDAICVQYTSTLTNISQMSDGSAYSDINVSQIFNDLKIKNGDT